MSALRQAIGAAYPAHNMDPDTVASITRAMQKREMREKAIAKATGEKPCLQIRCS